jgi:allene oxide cyclase
VLVFACAAWLVADHPGNAGAAKKPAVTQHGPIHHTANVVHVIEHAVTDTEVPSGGGADVTGNVLTFHNQVFNPADTKPVGTDLGSCVRISPAEGSWECSWTTMLAGGQLMVQGPYYDKKNSVLAITGGTGAFRHARGEMQLVSREGGKEYDFIFRLG